MSREPYVDRDGWCHIPPEQAAPVLRILICELGQHVRTSGLAPTAGARALVAALDTAMSASGTGAAGSSTLDAVMVTGESVASAAARMGATPRHIRRLCSLGKLPARRIGRDWLIETTGASDGEAK